MPSVSHTQTADEPRRAAWVVFIPVVAAPLAKWLIAAGLVVLVVSSASVLFRQAR
jgi:hypothetical protein